jgi:hypothetical protein
MSNPLVDWEVGGRVYQIPEKLTLTFPELIAREFDEAILYTGAAKVPEVDRLPTIRKIASTVRVTDEILRDQGPTLDQIMRMARDAQIARYIATQRELEWQDHEDWDSPAVERGYN